MGRAPCCSKVGLSRGPWSIKEDTILTTYIQEHGEGQWKSLPNNAGLLRCGKSCRLRWMNYLRPGIKRGNISQDEEDLIVRLHGLLGNRWSLIAGRLPGRTDNEIKNYWNTYIVKKLSNAGIKLKPNKNFRRLMESDKFVTSPASKESSAKIQETTKKICEEQNNCNDPPKTKVYRPKALRVSSMFSTTGSSVSRTSSNEDGQVARKVVGHATEEWPPRLEVKGANYGFFEAGDEDYFLGERFILQDSVSSTDDVKMWDKFYNEYLQLL